MGLRRARLLHDVAGLARGVRRGGPGIRGGFHVHTAEGPATSPTRSPSTAPGSWSASMTWDARAGVDRPLRPRHRRGARHPQGRRTRQWSTTRTRTWAMPLAPPRPSRRWARASAAARDRRLHRRHVRLGVGGEDPPEPPARRPHRRFRAGLEMLLGNNPKIAAKHFARPLGVPHARRICRPHHAQLRPDHPADRRLDRWAHPSSG